MPLVYFCDCRSWLLGVLFHTHTRSKTPWPSGPKVWPSMEMPRNFIFGNDVLCVISGWLVCLFRVWNIELLGAPMRSCTYTRSKMTFLTEKSGPRLQTEKSDLNGAVGSFWAGLPWEVGGGCLQGGVGGCPLRGMPVKASCKVVFPLHGLSG